MLEVVFVFSIIPSIKVGVLIIFYLLFFSAPFLHQGPLGVAVTYGGDHIPKSPFSVAVAPTLDLSKINVTGLGDSMYFLVTVIVFTI